MYKQAVKSTTNQPALLMPPRILVCCLIVAVACSREGSPPQARNDAFWFEGARLIVGDGSEPIESSAFLVEGDTIAWVGRQGERQPPQGAVRVDLSGKTVIPALIDGHNHIGLSTSGTAATARRTTRARTSSTSSSGTRTTVWRRR